MRLHYGHGMHIATHRASGVWGQEQKMTTRYTQAQRDTIIQGVRNSGPGAGETEKIRIRRDTTVEAYGRMPNTNRCGWWLAGIVEDFLPGNNGA